MLLPILLVTASLHVTLCTRMVHKASTFTVHGLFSCAAARTSVWGCHTVLDLFLSTVYRRVVFGRPLYLSFLWGPMSGMKTLRFFVRRFLCWLITHWSVKNKISFRENLDYVLTSRSGHQIFAKHKDMKNEISCT